MKNFDEFINEATVGDVDALCMKIRKASPKIMRAILNRLAYAHKPDHNPTDQEIVDIVNYIAAPGGSMRNMIMSGGTLFYNKIKDILEGNVSEGTERTGRMIKSGFHIVNLCAGDTILKPGPLPRKELTVTSVGQGEFTAKPSSGGREESYRTLSGFEPVKVKHLKESATRYEQSIKSEMPKDPAKWCSSFISFLDKPWQEDTEIYMVDQLSEYKDKFKGMPEAAWNYFQSWNRANRRLLDSKLGISTSDQFAQEYDALVGNEIKESLLENDPHKEFFNDVPVNKSINKSIVAMAKKIQKEFPELAIGDVMKKIDAHFKRLIQDSGSSQEKKSVLAGIVYDALALQK